MKILSRKQIKQELEKPNGPMLLAEDPNINKNLLMKEASALFIEEGLASALLVRLSKSRSLLLEMSTDTALLNAIRMALKNDSAKLRRNAARLLGNLSRENSDAELLIDALNKEDTRFVRPSMLLALGAVGGDEAQEFLSSYKVSPAADESEIKHYNEESEALKQAKAAAVKHEKHNFRSLDKIYEIELSTPDRLTEQLKGEFEDLGIDCYDIRRNSLKVKTDDYTGLFEARCFSEALFIIADGLDMKAENITEIIAGQAKAFMLPFMKNTHDGNPPYRYRIEISGNDNGSIENITEFKKQLRDLIACDELINAPSDYEVEIRLVPGISTARLYMKLLTVRDERFRYRIAAIPAAINPSTAAAILRFASEYLTVNARVIDPCCGSGTLLIERGLISPCASLTGVDIAHKAIDAARRNADAAALKMGVKQAKFIANDILRFECRRPYDELICNLPFGNRVGNHSTCEKLYSGLLDRLPMLVKQGGIALLYTMEFTLLKKLIREHKNLELLKQERTESGGLTPMIFILRVK